MIEMCASVAWAGAVRVKSASGRPSQAERSVGDKVEISRVVAFSTKGKFGFCDHQQPLVAGAGILSLGVADRPDQSLAA